MPMNIVLAACWSHIPPYGSLFHHLPFELFISWAHIFQAIIRLVGTAQNINQINLWWGFAILVFNALLFYIPQTVARENVFFFCRFSSNSIWCTCWMSTIDFSRSKPANAVLCTYHPKSSGSDVKDMSFSPNIVKLLSWENPAGSLAIGLELKSAVWRRRKWRISSGMSGISKNRE